MRHLAQRIIAEAGRWIPARLTNRLARLPFIQRLLFRVVNKEDAEMLFQYAWVQRYRRNPGVVEEYWRRYRELDRVLELVKPDSDVLDVGCGISTVLALLPGHRIGVDPLAARYKQIHRYPPGVEVLTSPAETLPFDTESFDLVISSNALDHMTDPAQALSEMRRVLRPDGRLVITCEVFDQSHQRDPAHPHAFDQARLLQIVAGAGFALEFTAQHPWIGISRYVEGMRTSDDHEVFIIARPSAMVGG